MIKGSPLYAAAPVAEKLCPPVGTSTHTIKWSNCKRSFHFPMAEKREKDQLMQLVNGQGCACNLQAKHNPEESEDPEKFL